MTEYAHEYAIAMLKQLNVNSLEQLRDWLEITKTNTWAYMQKDHKDTRKLPSDEIVRLHDDVKQTAYHLTAIINRLK